MPTDVSGPKRTGLLESIILKAIRASLPSKKKKIYVFNRQFVKATSLKVNLKDFINLLCFISDLRIAAIRNFKTRF